VAGCSQEETESTPVVQATALPVVTESVPQNMPEPTTTTAPTITTKPPTATDTPVPTETATHTPKPTSTPSPTPTPTPVFLTTEEDFGGERNPLTGELVDDPAVLQRRPIAVKISNSPAEYVRPQSGLSQADIVFEHATEGPITRFTAIIYGQTPPDMGPIRSARLIDVELPAMYDAALAFSGSSIGVSEKLFGSDFRPRILRSYEPGYYRTGEDKPYEHTFYGNPASFWESLDERDQNFAPSYSSLMTFSSEPPEGGELAAAVNVRYRDFTSVDWVYDPENGRYWRWADGEEHIDANNGQQINAANVILIYAIHILDESICEHQSDGKCHAFSTEIQIFEQGPVLIIRDGRAYEGMWKRDGRNSMFTFHDEEDNPIPLQIGNSWVQVIPMHYFDPVTISP
jgi:hypothetical protein